VVQALEGVTISIEHGDRVGLVGHNGAGKTTLLRVLAGIFEPAQGAVRISGRPVPLFDIGLGMDSEGTGYENIYLRGLFLGMTRKEISERLNDIANFTELGDFLRLPIRTYSTGMRMRLAFAISTSVEPDILLLDEGIGAGDAAFVDKANQRIRSFEHKAGIIVLASHSEQLVRRICSTAVLMEHGRVIEIGAVDTVLERYRERSKSQSQPS
jgi:ABC-2 type transport system ATP-binding protein/lipopolysaccharide transport system ATP-binding protein